MLMRRPGLEPTPPECRSGVLPLHHDAKSQMLQPEMQLYKQTLQLHRPTPMLHPQPRMDMQTDVTLVTALQSQLGRGQAPGNLPVYITFEEMTRHLYHCWYRSCHGGIPLIRQHPSIHLSYTLRHYCMMQHDTKAKKVSASART